MPSTVGVPKIFKSCQQASIQEITFLG